MPDINDILDRSARNERLNQHYRDEGWGHIADAVGIPPVHAEGQARQVCRYAAEEIARKDALIAELAESLSHSEEENGIGYIEDKHPPFRCNHCLKRSDWLDAMEHTAACIITRAKSEIGQ